MNRFVVLVGAVAAAGLAVLTADSEGSGWTAPPHGDMQRLGRSERQVLRGAASATLPGDVVPGFDARDPFGGAGAVPSAAGPADAQTPPTSAAAGAGDTAATAPPVEDEVPLTRTVVEIRDFEPCVIDGGGDHFLGKRILIYLGEEGDIWWISRDAATGDEKRTSISDQDVLEKNVKNQIGATLVVVPNQWTNWQEVQKSFRTGAAGRADQVFLGAVTATAPNVLKTIPIVACSEDLPPPETPFSIEVKEGTDGPDLTINGEACESFPTDLAIKWNEWRKEHPDADVSTIDTCVILDVHRFTPMSQVAPIFVVLRDLGIDAERYTGAIFERKRR